MMKIVFLGTGDAFTKLYYQTNLLLLWENTNLLIDFGTTGPLSLYDLGIPLTDIQNVFISHLHADHIGGLEELGLQSRYVFRKKIHLYTAEPLVEELWEHSLRGGMEYTGNGGGNLDYYFHVHPVQDTFTIGDLSFEIVPTLHVKDMKSYGLWFDRIFYSNDSIYNEPLVLEMAKRSDLLIHDCTFKENPVHTYFESLFALPPHIQRRMYLVHYNDGSEEKRSMMRQRGFRCAEKHQYLKID
jgi:ribonuclease BN (tRNA processing enzyme)